MYMWPSTLKNIYQNSKLVLQNDQSETLAQRRATTQRHTKSILRKARLHLNKRTLQKLRKPDCVNRLSAQFENDKKAVQSPVKLSSFPMVSLESLESNAASTITKNSHDSSKLIKLFVLLPEKGRDWGIPRLPLHWLIPYATLQSSSYEKMKPGSCKRTGVLNI